MIDQSIVSVVVPTFNRKDMLPSVIAPLLRDPATLEVVVVVDGCHDGSYELLERYAIDDPRVRPVWQDNAGEAAARAAGVEAARGTIVLILDDDVVACEGLVSGHASFHRASDRSVVLGYMPTVLPAKRQPGEAATYLYARDYEQACRAYERDARQVLLRFWAGNCSMRRDDALRVGMRGSRRDARLGYHADRQFGYDCLAEGLRGSFSRSLRATHCYQRSVDKLRGEIRRQVHARRVLAEEHPGVVLGRRPRCMTRAALTVLARQPVYSLCLGATLTSITVAGRLHLWALETALVRGLRQVELVHAEQHES